jgi:hypothetical protein
MRRLTVQVKSGVRSQHFAFHSLNARTHSWMCLEEPQPSGVRFAEFVARVHFLLKNPQIIPNHDDFVDECLEAAMPGKLTSTEANIPHAA